MSYESVSPAYYQFRQPETPWHAGSQGWSKAPVPIWGTNPNFRATPRIAVSGCPSCGLGVERSTLTWIGWAAGAGLLTLILWPRVKRMRSNPSRRRHRRNTRRKASASHIRTLSRKPLKELRRMQSIVQAQIPVAYESRNTKALGELQTRDKEIAAAIDLREFGD